MVLTDNQNKNIMQNTFTHKRTYRYTIRIHCV